MSQQFKTVMETIIPHTFKTFHLLYLLYWTDFTNWSHTLLPLAPLFDNCSWNSKTAVGKIIPESFQTSANFSQNHFKDGIKVKFALGEMKSFQSCSRLFTQHNWIRDGGDEEEVESLGSEENGTWKQAGPLEAQCVLWRPPRKERLTQTHPHPLYQCGLGCTIRLHNPIKTSFLS